MLECAYGTIYTVCVYVCGCVCVCVCVCYTVILKKGLMRNIFLLNHVDLSPKIDIEEKKTMGKKNNEPYWEEGSIRNEILLLKKII